MKKMINSEHIEGYLYQHNLSIKKVQNEKSKNFGTDFITGEINIAVDEEGLNVIPVHFTYVTEIASSGKKNETFIVLKRILKDNETWIASGKDNALKIKVDRTTLNINDFYNRENVLITSKKNEGGFVTIVNELCPEDDRNSFMVDIVITNVTRVEADEEKGIESDYGIVKGAIFDFKNALLPVDFTVRNENGLSYFEDQDISASNPFFTKIWGKINCETIVKSIVEECAFGESAVKTIEKKTREWTITKAAKVPYEFGEEGYLTVEELKKAMQDREIALAEVKKKSEEYRNNNTVSNNTTTVAVKPGDFNF